MLSRLTKHEPPTWLLITAIIFFTSLLSAAAALWLFNSANTNRVFPGVYVGQLNLGGLSETEAFTKINSAIDNYRQNGIIFTYKGARKTLPLEITDYSSESVETLIDFNADKMTARALGYGRDADTITNTFHQLNALLSRHYIAPSYALNEAAIKKYLVESFKQDIRLSEPAKIVFANDEFIIEPEKKGFTLNFENLVPSIEELASQLQTGTIEIKMTETKPSLTSEQLSSMIREANSQLLNSPLTLNYQKKKWQIKKEILGKWLSLPTEEGDASLTLNKTEVINYLSKNIAPTIEIKATDAKFVMKNGRATAFGIAKDGLGIDATTTLQNIYNDWLSNKTASSSIATVKIPSQSTSSTNDLGITELIGVGTSNFTGSSANRKHNIKIGMNTLSGVLIKPGETFSVMRKLGSIDGSKGYLEELVIKKDKTQKEFGGGLCQVGTTMFRAALATGLPINERRNHSYRVSYYEPAGTDATIYDPAPDLKFTNDTANYVLIQGYITGNKLVFEFWGTKDGRKVNQTYPKIYNIVKPKPARIIETLSLAPGVKKCTEKAHNGADASFNYTVTYLNGEVKNKTFNSHYVPWQEVCLIGVSKLSPVASSTPSSTGTTASTTKTTTETSVAPSDVAKPTTPATSSTN